ncbi:16S rRNA (guanine(527)-N(7))-methyltransferase RsmG [Prolixibacteraceae bacterium JC049]|nr:16S rRNA (guanine(527)-N(7))-methyltransferase RsmG [Prolixibacteraceae bacterium JC049]
MEQVLKYFPDLTDKQKEQFRMLGELYPEWNDKINVISRKDIDQLYERHVLHSLAIDKVIKFAKGTKVMDVGTGGGFPGIPLAIMNPDSEFYLIDAIGKKIQVVNGVAEALGLKNVKAEQIRVQQVKGKFDFVVSRAVTAFPKFVNMVRTKVKPGMKNTLPNGIIYLKGGDFMEELQDYVKQTRIYELPDFYEEEFFETKKIIHLPL